MRCSRCHVEKPSGEFSPTMVARGSGYCRPCHRAYYVGRARDPILKAATKKRSAERLRADPVRAAANVRRVKNKDLRRRYGISLAEYEARLSAQGGGCACCGSEDPVGPSFRVDHDHASGAIRGLLCNKCNSGIGMLGDSVEGIARALDYLTRTTTARGSTSSTDVASVSVH